MKAIFGLGNPGKKYALTRHNAGFLALDKIKKAYAFPEFKFEKKFRAEISQSSPEGEEFIPDKKKKSKIILIKPQTFMNQSGLSIRAILDFYKIPPDDILIIHDDLDIELGKYKISANSRSAGHNGVQNIIESLGTQKFKRIRIGIAKPPEEKKTCIFSAHGYVLEKFSKKELDLLEEVFKNAIEEIKKMET
jgi:PTH1 family peptidyl-tRNA hydrolase